ncbi:right-handed parallel beta-helix repeat-containing protein (plasmid) [Halorussus limi]|uniref:Right-handed parallel beta-helix repeat-containing protein n=1 Tax=Halorussus limi TaxID=2938695 RepID=A0A8U0I0T5_9EURY|nr:NosD domain-containing protein [Halorussus limi]UPV76516.1 right-handed parallel beta-helix repeat-containing protein [Halorussus limi]
MSRALVVGIALLLASTPAAPSVADAAQSEPATIDSCETIDEPGRYALAADLRNVSAGQCISIRASDVTLLGRGHLVDGRGAFGSAGVSVGAWDRPVSNVTVRNLTVAEWDDAVRLTAADRGRLADVTATRSRVGVRLYGASRNRLADVRATDNAVHGVSLLDDSDGNRASDVTAARNALFGVHLGADSSRNRVENVTARANEYGVTVVGADDNRIVGGRAVGNRIAGVWLSAADGNSVADLRLDNRFYGAFLADGAANNSLLGNRAIGNPVGFRLRNSDGNRLRDNTARRNRDGFLLIESDRNAVVGNRIVGNRRGVSLLASDDNRVEGNDFRRNRRTFVVARGSENNSVPE